VGSSTVAIDCWLRQKGYFSIYQIIGEAESSIHQSTIFLYFGGFRKYEKTSKKLFKRKVIIINLVEI